MHVTVIMVKKRSIVAKFKFRLLYISMNTSNYDNKPKYTRQNRLLYHPWLAVLSTNFVITLWQLCSLVGLWNWAATVVTLSQYCNLARHNVDTHSHNIVWTLSQCCSLVAFQCWAPTLVQRWGNNAMTLSPCCYFGQTKIVVQHFHSVACTSTQRYPDI